MPIWISSSAISISKMPLVSKSLASSATSRASRWRARRSTVRSASSASCRVSPVLSGSSSYKVGALSGKTMRAMSAAASSISSMLSLRHLHAISAKPQFSSRR